MKIRIKLSDWMCLLSGTIILILLIAACSPVNRLTRAKKVPREYRINYDSQWAKASKKFYWNTDPWIVYSDGSDNKTYTRPGGRIVMKKIGFMEPLVVIKRKGDYFRVIRYAKEVIKDGKLTNRKAAEYMGWIPKTEIVLSRDAVTSVRNSLHSKFVTAIQEQAPLLSPDVYIQTDSIRVFSDKSLIQQQGTLPFNSIVYKIKESADGKKSLVSREPYLAADSARKQVIGWVSNCLLAQAGQQYYIGENTGISQVYGYPNSALKYTPVNYYCRQDSTRKISTGLYRPVLDYSNNYVLNVDGHKISFADYLQIGINLSKVNLVFVVEGGKLAISQFPQLVNTIQNLQKRIEGKDGNVSYTFSAVMGFQKEKKQFVHITEETVFLSFMDSLYSINDHIDKYKPLYPSGASSALAETLRGLKVKKDEVNLIVLIGETGYQGEKNITSWAGQMAAYNCRLLGFQLYGGETDTYNNFVIQVQNIIDRYAELLSIRKRELLVSTEQLRSGNQYKEYSRNMYALDFPKNSMTQGLAIFPGKNRTLELNGLSAGIDTLLTQIGEDNKSVMNYLTNAFRQTGNYRSRFDSLMTDYYKIQNNPQQERVFANQFRNQSPTWYSESAVWYLPDSLLSEFGHYLLVNSRELKQVLEFIKSISDTQLDIDMRGTRSSTPGKKNMCDCPEPIVPEHSTLNSDTLSEVKYRSTRKIRKQLVRYYLRRANENRVCRISKRVLKRHNLAWIHEHILGCPAKEQFLSTIRLRDIRKKRRLTDKELDKLLLYYLQKREALELNISNLPHFVSNTQFYYWINGELLP